MSAWLTKNNPKKMVLCPSSKILLLVLFNKWKQLKKHTIYKMLHKTTLKLQGRIDIQQQSCFQIQFRGKVLFLLCPSHLNSLSRESIIALKVTGRDCCQVNETRTLSLQRCIKMHSDGLIRSGHLLYYACKWELMSTECQQLFCWVW